jgi:para-aminobenzoate synthetase/4-amino-4-deoxychorismate lyase
LRIQFQFEKSRLAFDHPARIITCHEPQKLKFAFNEVERALDRGLTVAGFLSYEAGYAFEPKFDFKKASGFPLVHFGCYEQPAKNFDLSPASPDPLNITDLSINMTREEYDANINRIRDYIAAGDVYQITYCLKTRFGFRGDPIQLYRTLLREQPVPYASYIETDERTILSLSPEMFLKKKGGHITTKPMKGTWPRGKGLWSDLMNRRIFGNDEKNRAENIMIVDLLRNDLGKLGKDIRTPKIYEVTPYKTLFQMTSTVTGKIDQNIKVYDLFKAIFPSGSVTGAPKIRAMEIIRDIEKEDRKIYTGAIGYIRPNKDMFFNIPIRTFLLEKGRGELGIGGGIVWDSTPEGEWAEGMLKARFFTDLSKKDKAI